MRVRIGAIGGSLACCIALALIAQASSQALANDAFWHGVRSPDWNHGIHPPTKTSNWYSELPPLGDPRPVPDGTATFADGAQRKTVEVKDNTEILTMVFPANTPRYEFSIEVDKQLLLSGNGVINGSVAPVISIFGALRFSQSATVIGDAGIGARIINENNGNLSFLNISSGGNAVVENKAGGQIGFFDRSSADDMNITNVAGGSPATTQFLNRSNGGRAEFTNQAGSILGFDLTTGPAGDGRVSAGKIDNAGSLNVGVNTLRVRNDFTQTASGLLRLAVTQDSTGQVVAKTATVGGDLVLEGRRDLPAGRYTILRTDLGVNGKFAKVKFIRFPADAQPRLNYFAKQIVLVTR